MPRRCEAHEVIPACRVLLNEQGLIYRAEDVVCEVWDDLDEAVDVLLDALRGEPAQEVQAGGEGIVHEGRAG